MKPRIITLKEKKLIGMKLNMSMINNLTGTLWSKFGPRINEVSHMVSNDKFSMQVFDRSYFSEFNPHKEFTKWAAVEVSELKNIPKEMESFLLAEGLYAVFNYKGSSADSSIFEYIYSQWIPNASYQLDDRPHFEVLGEKYKNNDPDSEEEIWIPIKKKASIL